jgi:hypothetical protein
MLRRLLWDWMSGGSILVMAVCIAAVGLSGCQATATGGSAAVVAGRDLDLTDTGCVDKAYTPCWLGALCASGCDPNDADCFCACRAQCPVDSGKGSDLPNGAQCVEGDDCKSGVCGYQGNEKTGVSGKYCCDSTTYSPGDLTYYCDDQPDGNWCPKNTVCSSGWCDGSSYPVVAGVCAATKAAGESCSHDDECANDACARLDSDSLICCPSGKSFLRFSGYDWCYTSKDGPCVHDDQCPGDQDCDCDDDTRCC